MRSNARFRASRSRSPRRNELVASASESSLSRTARCTSRASCFAAMELASSSWARSSRCPEGSVNMVARVSGAALAHASNNASLRPNRIGELFHSGGPCDKGLTRGQAGVVSDGRERSCVRRNRASHRKLRRIYFGPHAKTAESTLRAALPRHDIYGDERSAGPEGAACALAARLPDGGVENDHVHGFIR